MVKRKINSNAEICRSLVNQLEQHLIQFRGACLKVDDKDVPEILKHAIYEFGVDVIHFIDQYRMTDKSVADINKIPGRKIKFKEREFFRESIKEFQKNTPEDFPSWPDFLNTLENLNEERIKSSLPELSIESRTYDQWKKWWREGTFDYLVHD
jgi:hypothetical protein